MGRRLSTTLLVLSMSFVMGVVVLGLFSAIREMRAESRLKCDPGYRLIKHRGEFYCTPGYRP